MIASSGTFIVIPAGAYSYSTISAEAKSDTESKSTKEKINNKLNQFKTSIDVLINQNNEYVNGIKRYSNKDFLFEKKENETLEEQRNKADTMLDQLDDIHKRNKLILQIVDEFEKIFN